MRDVVAWIRRRALWSLPLLGALLIVGTWCAWREGRVRRAYLRDPRHVGLTCTFNLRKMIEWMDPDAALVACDAMEREYPRARREVDVVRARIRVQSGRSPESELAAYLSPREEAAVWHQAVEQTLELRMRRGDVEGANALLEEIASGRLSRPEWDALPFPYLRHWGAMELARRLATVEPRRAHAWALRAKFDEAIDVPWDIMPGCFTETEALLESTARQAGFRYAKESFDRDRFNRRVYGPGLGEGGVRVLVGAALIIAGAVLIGGTPRSRRVFTWSFFWRRRGPWARFGLGTYVLGFALSLVLALKPSLADGPFPPDETTLLVAGLISLAYTAVFIPFVGCFVAEPTASTGS